MNILATILIIFADILFVISMLTKKKSHLVVILLISDVFFAGQYLCFDDGLTGALSVLVDIVFLLTTYVLEKYHKEKYTWIASIIAIIITIIFTVISWSGAISLLPMFSMIAYLIAMIINKLYFVKAGCLIRNILNIIYMFLLSQYIGAVLEIGLAISAVVGIIISIRNSKTSNSSQVENVNY